MKTLLDILLNVLLAEVLLWAADEDALDIVGYRT